MIRFPSGEVVTASVFMGRGAKALIEVPITTKDTLKTQLQQWAALKTAFSRRRTGKLILAYQQLNYHCTPTLPLHLL